MIAGPRWTGKTPPRITKVFRCETDFGCALIRTQLFDAADLENVKRIQAGYRGTPLSGFLKRRRLPQPRQSTGQRSTSRLRVVACELLVQRPPSAAMLARNLAHPATSH